MAAIKRKKLYFFVNLDEASAANGTPTDPPDYTTALCRCTQGRRNGVPSTYAGDAYGGVLEDLPALTVGSPGFRKAQREVTAWFERHSSGLSPTVSNVFVDFVNWTTNTGGAAPLAIAYGQQQLYAVGPQGSSAVYTRDFAVRVMRRFGTPTVRGVLYVERQHVIEV